MKKYLTAAFIAFVSAAAFADGSPCEDTAYMIQRLEREQQSASGTEAQNINSLLAAAYDTYNANGCK